jgi:hypothetical protein
LISFTDGTDVKDGISVAGEHRTGPLDGVIDPADEQRQLSRGDVVGCAAYRSIDHVDAM